MFGSVVRSRFVLCTAVVALALIFRVEPVDAASTPKIIGAWETSAWHDGIVFWPSGQVYFYNYQHRCPTFWATFVVYNNHIEARELQSKKIRSLLLVSSSELRDNFTGYIYHRVPNVEFKSNPTHC